MREGREIKVYTSTNFIFVKNCIHTHSQHDVGYKVSSQVLKYKRSVCGVWASQGSTTVFAKLDFFVAGSKPSYKARPPSFSTPVRNFSAVRE
jgi:hypothetical protein